MEKRLICVALYLILFLGFASSQIVLEELNKDLQAGETFVGFFEVNLVNSLDINDFNVYSGRRSVEFEKGIYTNGNKTFLYVIFSNEGNFTIQTNSFLYYSGSDLVEGKLNHSIYIKSPSEDVLTLSPGIVSGDNLSFIAKNIGHNSLSLNVQSNTTIIEKDSSKRIFVYPQDKFFYLDIGTYRNFKLPIFYFNDSNEGTQNNSDINESKDDIIVLPFSLRELKLERNFTRNHSFFVGVFIENLLEEDIELKVASRSNQLVFNDTFFIGALRTKEYLFEFSSDYEMVYSSNLSFSFEDYEQNLSLLFFVLEDEDSFEEFFSYDPFLDDRVCGDVGAVCSDGQFCSPEGRLSNVGGELCCVGAPCISLGSVEKPRRNYFIGFLFFIIAAVLGYFLYKKFKNVKASPRI